jgi:hypothetical protein
MSGEADARLARLKRLPLRLRVAHLAALLRCEPDASSRTAELKHLLTSLTDVSLG